MPIAAVAELVRRETGIARTVATDKVVHTALRRIAPDLEPTAFIRAAADPVRGRGLVERLIDEVTVQETTFVRPRAARYHPLAQPAARRPGGGLGRHPRVERRLRDWGGALHAGPAGGRGLRPGAASR